MFSYLCFVSLDIRSEELSSYITMTGEENCLYIKMRIRLQDIWP